MSLCGTVMVCMKKKNLTIGLHKMFVVSTHAA